MRCAVVHQDARYVELEITLSEDYSMQLVARNGQGFERNSVVHQDARYIKLEIALGWGCSVQLVTRNK